MKEQHKRFIDAYIETNNASTAAVRAGYSSSNAANTGCRLMAKQEIRDEIAKKRSKYAISADAKRIYSLSEVLQHLTIISNDPETPFAVRVRALELLGKHHGAFIDRQETTIDAKLDHVDSAALLKLLQAEDAISQNDN